MRGAVPGFSTGSAARIPGYRKEDEKEEITDTEKGESVMMDSPFSYHLKDIELQVIGLRDIP